MVDRELLQWLHENSIIDKRKVLWWQLGFEGRRIFSEEEFNAGLKRETYEVTFKLESGPVSPYQFSCDVWIRDEVPILRKDTEIRGRQVPVFVTVKPMSHPSHGGHGGGWWDLNCARTPPDSHPLGFYLSPHIRGVVIDQTPEFLFWSPFTWGVDEGYETWKQTLPNEKFPLILSPVGLSKFHKNLIKRSWPRGKRPQIKAKSLDLETRGIQVVPFYEFDPTKNHVMAYPARLFEDRLDVPVIVAGDAEIRRPQILGAGYINVTGLRKTDPPFVDYWPLDNSMEKRAKRSLISRLGRFHN